VKPKYLGKPIGSEAALAATLGISVDVLRDYSATVADKYSTFEIPKRDGKLRPICSPTHNLKIIQKRINRFIFGNVEYPDYLFGGIAGQDYVKNASRHTGAKALITLDVRDFYPCIKAKAVENIFLHFCKFPPPVVKLLTELTTLNGCVPQGACTSSHLANLVFHDLEHRVVSDFKDKKIIYSRLLDDICISSSKILKKEQVTDAISKVAALLKARGFKIRGNKTHVTSISNPEELMEITGLWLNRGRPRAKPQDREDIRSEMHRCEVNFAVSRIAPAYHQEHDSLSGRVAKLTYLEHHEAASFRSRLRKILPHYGELETKRIQLLVGVLERTSKADRGKYSYVDRFHKLGHKINILSRTEKYIAYNLRVRMYHCFPTNTKEVLIYGNES
jgi:hypothetical protein